MRTYYYNLEDAEFINTEGEKLPRCVPELSYQERAQWKLFLRDRENAVYDLSGIVGWSAAVACDFRSDTPPMCRTAGDGISADPGTGCVTVTLDAATAEFLAAVDGDRSRSADFELCGFNAAGERAICLAFAITARMCLDPDPTVAPTVPDTLATRTFVSSLLVSSAAAVLSEVVSGAFVNYPTSSGASSIASQVVASGGYARQTVVTSSDVTSAFIPVLSGGTQYRYTQPLSVLSVGSVADVPVEDEIVFSAGAVVTPPTGLTIIASAWVDIQNGVAGSTTEGAKFSHTLVTLTSAGGWSAETSVCSEFWDGELDVVLSCTMSAALVSSGGGYVISCWGENYMERLEYADYDNESHTVSYSGIFASSPDMKNWTVIDSTCMIWGVATVDWGGIDERALQFTSFGFDTDETVTPCEISLPPTVRFMNSNSLMTVSSGGVYAMNFKDNVLAMGEVKEPEAAE